MNAGCSFAVSPMKSLVQCGVQLPLESPGLHLDWPGLPVDTRSWRHRYFLSACGGWAGEGGGPGLQKLFRETYEGTQSRWVQRAQSSVSREQSRVTREWLRGTQMRNTESGHKEQPDLCGEGVVLLGPSAHVWLNPCHVWGSRGREKTHGNEPWAWGWRSFGALSGRHLHPVFHDAASHRTRSRELPGQCEK